MRQSANFQKTKPEVSSQRDEHGVPHDGKRQRDGPDQSELLHAIIADCGNPVEVMELYYWSRDPSLLDLIRALMKLPRLTRMELELYLTDVVDPETVSIVREDSSRLTLCPIGHSGMLENEPETETGLNSD